MKKLILLLVLSGGIAHAQNKPKPVQPVEPEPMPIEIMTFAAEPEWVNKDQVMRLLYYPDMAREAQIQGKVFAEVLIDKAGHCVKHRIVKSAHPILTSAVEKVLPHTLFRPAMEFSRPANVWVLIPFQFRIED